MYKSDQISLGGTVNVREDYSIEFLGARTFTAQILTFSMFDIDFHRDLWMLKNGMANY